VAGAHRRIADAQAEDGLGRVAGLQRLEPGRIEGAFRVRSVRAGGVLFGDLLLQQRHEPRPPFRDQRFDGAAEDQKDQFLARVERACGLAGIG